MPVAGRRQRGPDVVPHVGRHEPQLRHRERDRPTFPSRRGGARRSQPCGPTTAATPRRAPRPAPAGSARRASRSRAPSARPPRGAGGEIDRDRGRHAGAGGAARSAGWRGRCARLRRAACSSSRSSSSTAGRFVATTAASNATPCAGPDVGQVGTLERDPSRRHVPARVSDDQLGEQHKTLPTGIRSRSWCRMQAVRRTPGTRDQTQPVPSYPKIPHDTAEYERQTRADSSAGRCFICSIVAGEREDHLVVFNDDVCIAFLAKWPTLLGYTLVAPLDHRTDAVGSFTEAEYVELQRRVHRVGCAVSGAVPTERLYVLDARKPSGQRPRALACGTAPTRRAVPGAAVRRAHARERLPRHPGHRPCRGRGRIQEQLSKPS